mmetsp:Transcript_68023/g.106349  ORF Transcript_68023/g.106349 Transcript_68023/m.106349 type:complete len:215 (-) Transcript_68023:321-965(-)
MKVHSRISSFSRCSCHRLAACECRAAEGGGADKRATVGVSPVHPVLSVLLAVTRFTVGRNEHSAISRASLWRRRSSRFWARRNSHISRRWEKADADELQLLVNEETELFCGLLKPSLLADLFNLNSSYLAQDELLQNGNEEWKSTPSGDTGDGHGKSAARFLGDSELPRAHISCAKAVASCSVRSGGTPRVSALCPSAASTGRRATPALGKVWS